MASKKKLTPLMQQYWEIKSAHTDKVLLFRMGDFFEMFHEDAITAAPILDIALTQRNKKAEDETPMCGVPHHSIAGPINKLLAAGFRVAICDQVEDPKEAKGIVKRAVTRILSPGMVFDADTLDDQASNYLCAYDDEYISFLETTTGEAFSYPLSEKRQAHHLLNVMPVQELVVSETQEPEALERRKLGGPFVSKHASEEVIEAKWPTSANRLVSYAVHMQGPEIQQLIRGFERRQLRKRLELSATTVRHLEIFQNGRGEKNGSLVQAIQRTKSSIGARKLRQWLRFPLTDQASIEKRLDEVERWLAQPALTKEVRQLLSQLGDIERRLGKVTTPQFHPRDLLSIAQSLQVGVEVSQHLGHLLEGESQRREFLEVARGLVVEIRDMIVDEPPAAMKNGGFLQKGVHADLDELITLSNDGQKMLRDLEAREREITGIGSLKIRYNNVFGYYIEVTNAHKDKVPASYMRKQTLTNAERYVTAELSELEEKILSAKTRRTELEFEIFAAMKKRLLQEAPKILDLAVLWSEVDVFTSMAWLAMENNFCRPQFSEDRRLNLQGSRHPVVEQEVSQRFVPNDLELKAHECLMLTGPNMAGKSTLMRQVAIAAILAQMGCFVPAKRAVLPIFENIYTRIGASDFLSEGLSTFMVEMTETAEMLKNTNQNCLVILDEVGRGTSTYDGMSLARAILEYLLESRKSMTLFATHYHELTEMSESFPQLTNAHMTINEVGGEIQFLHTLQMGAASKSYGIEVAKLAGLPKAVIRRADQVLKGLESEPRKQLSFLDGLVEEETVSEEEEQSRENQAALIRELRTLSVPSITPLEALNKLAQWQNHLQEDGPSH